MGWDDDPPPGKDTDNEHPMNDEHFKVSEIIKNLNETDFRRQRSNSVSGTPVCGIQKDTANFIKIITSKKGVENLLVKNKGPKNN